MKTIPLTRGQFAMVDDADHEWLSSMKWHACEARNNTFTVNRVAATYPLDTRKSKPFRIPMQVELMGWKEGFVVDHKDRNPLNNCRDNLRWATRAQNAYNSVRPNSIGAKGVRPHRRKWAVTVCHNYRHIYVGLFSTIEEAKAAYREASLRYHGEFSQTEVK